MRAGGPCGSKIFGRIVGPVCVVALDAAVPERGAQISAAACTRSLVASMNTKKNTAKKVAVENLFVFISDTGEVYPYFLKNCASQKMPVKGIEPSRPARGNGF